MRKKIAIVVQRYGLEINGGAEYHARLIAKRLCRNHSVEVLSTNAIDYVTWAPFYPEGEDVIEGIRIHRFGVDKERDPKKFGDLQKIILNEEHSGSLEEEWMNEQGPVSSALTEYVKDNHNRYDLFVFFSFRYHITFTMLPLLAHKSILVPTAEHDDIIYLRLFKNFFHLPAAIAYNSYEERAMIWRISQNQHVPGVVVGVGSEIPSRADGDEFRKKYHIDTPYCLYIGRLDENKGVPELFDFFKRFIEEYPDDPLQLVLAGKTILDIPEHEKIRYIGFIDDKDKFDALDGAALLIIPSQFESLSMVTLEAWAMGKPVLANGRTEVLKGQCQRSQAGLWYTNYPEFCHSLRLISGSDRLREGLGKNGRQFFIDHYTWPVIEAKYNELIDIVGGSQVKRENPE